MLSKGIKRGISLVLSFCFLFISAFSLIDSVGIKDAQAAETAAQLQEKKEKIQSKINDAQKEIDKLEKQKTETKDTISALDKKIALLQDQINVLQADIDALQEQIKKTQDNIDKTEQEIVKTQQEIDRLQALFDKTFAEYCQRLRAMYVSGHASSLEVLLTSEDIGSILTRSQMIKSVSQQDSKTLDDLMNTMAEIEKAKAELEKKRNQLKEDKKTLETSKKSLEENMDSMKASKTELNGEVSKANALMKKLNDDTSEYQEAIETNEAQLAEVQRDIDAAYARASRGTGSISGSTGTGAHSGTLGYPTYSRTVSAGYPNYSSGRYHGGVDFRCPSGTRVNAAASGTVIVAKNLNYSYGHYLIIDHGNGLSTLYAHNTTLLVGVGDKVVKGQQIAFSGSTGNSTGPHCHFEVRVNGTRVNPWNYL